MSAGQALKVWTIGHSTRGLEEFLSILAAHGVRGIADVRRFPASQRHPQFNRGCLTQTLAAAGVAYVWLPELGGRRVPRPDSPHTVWRSASFRGYADHMDTAAFREGAERLLAFARAQDTAIMCAEALWWRCHRALISDHLKSHGVEVLHITDAAHTEPHVYLSAAHIAEGRL